MVEAQVKRRVMKPLGLYIITALDFFAVGLLPLITIVWVARSSEGDVSFIGVLLSVGLAMSTMAASVWAFVGDNAGRYLLLVLVTLTSLLIIGNSLLSLRSEDAGVSEIRSIGWVVRATFWIGINWWYFNRAHVVTYFKRNAS